MNSNDLRQSFIDFFSSKGHKAVSSAPMVIKNDPTLMFTNAGMNQFKDIFLGVSDAKNKRVANSQKCLRVSGKHNDLEEVGHDTYHHTMFEMLGNWSFNDYFKTEAIDYAWEYLVDVLKIDSELLYATVFEGNEKESLSFDDEAYSCWKKYLPEERIVKGSKKDNFWEMGETGPCGPCSEIHIDLRNPDEKSKIPGKSLVNTGSPEVIEIWNIVFIQYNRKADDSLETLPEKHIDTGMGFERLCRIIQNKTSNYDTDIFRNIINIIEHYTEIKYGHNEKSDIAMRVIADHLRAVSFSIADGQVPSNNKAGYVIRRIIRRAIRYYYTYLNQKNPLIFKLVSSLSESMGKAYPELEKQKTLIEKVVKEEEVTFLKTLETGIKMLDNIISETKEKNKTIIPGQNAFVLYDTYGFPFDLTQLILKEQGMSVDVTEFEKEMELQKTRSRKDAETETGDWIIVSDIQQTFTGYDSLETNSKITRYRKVLQKGKTLFQIILDKTPFYGESGGQCGDKGKLTFENKVIPVIDTKTENNQIIHIAEKLPANINSECKAEVDTDSRASTASNHTATHLLHFALRQILGTHIEQKGSMVNPDYLRFDFSHFQKINDDELRTVEIKVNEMIRSNIQLEEFRNMPIDQARELGAMALFGEKYGDSVRVIKYGGSIELCGGTHIVSTGQIGHFRIISEGSIAAGIRRIEAATSNKADGLYYNAIGQLNKIKALLGNPPDIEKAIKNLIEQNSNLKSISEHYAEEEIKQIKISLREKIEQTGNIKHLSAIINTKSPQTLKDICFQLRNEIPNLFVVAGAEIDDKAYISIAISDDIIKLYPLKADKIIREVSGEINGGGGGQPFYASAGGKKPEGLKSAINKAMEIFLSSVKQ